MIISIPKKIYKKAVLRNQIRRRIRPILREFKPLLKPNKYLLIVKSGAEGIKGESLKKELAQAFKIS